MNIVHENPAVHKTQNDTLTTLDLIEHMAAHHTEQASDLTQLAKWHRQQAQALIAERRTLAADVDAALAEAEGLLR